MSDSILDNFFSYTVDLIQSIFTSIQQRQIFCLLGRSPTIFGKVKFALLSYESFLAMSQLLYFISKYSNPTRHVNLMKKLAMGLFLKN